MTSKSREKIFILPQSAVNGGNVNIDKIVIFDLYNKSSFAQIRILSILLATKKNEELTLLCVLLWKMNKYVKKFDDTKTMCFLVKDEKLLTKYNEIQWIQRN